MGLSFLFVKDTNGNKRHAWLRNTLCALLRRNVRSLLRPCGVCVAACYIACCPGWGTLPVILPQNRLFGLLFIWLVLTLIFHIMLY